MFETMGQFYAFFIPTLILIILGIIFEKKLIRVEQALAKAVRQTVKERKKLHE